MEVAGPGCWGVLGGSVALCRDKEVEHVDGLHREKGPNETQRSTHRREE